jgi:hypothetical protein
MIRASEGKPELIETTATATIKCGSASSLATSYPDAEALSESRRTTTINYDFNRPTVFRQSDLA